MKWPELLAKATTNGVRTMTRAADTVPTNTRKGMLAMRRRAIRARKVGTVATARAAKAAEQALIERGVDPQQLSVALAEGAELARKELARTTRRTRRKLARKTRRTRRDLARAATRARKQAANVRPVARTQRSAKQLRQDAKRTMRDAKRMARAEGTKSGRRRWWLWVLTAGLIAAVGYAVRSSGQPAQAVPGPRDAEDETSSGEEHRRQRNGLHMPPHTSGRRDRR
jgi:hypothetical protein